MMPGSFCMHALVSRCLLRRVFTVRGTWGYLASRVSFVGVIRRVRPFGGKAYQRGVE